MSTMRLLHVVPHVDDEVSGPSYSVPRLCQGLAGHGHQIGLMCLAGPASLPGVALDVHRQWRFPARFAVSPGLAHALWRQAAEVDVVHNHSLWSMANVAAGWVVPGRGAKLVTSPRGTLSAWALAHSGGVKRIVWPLQRRALALADLLHATSDQEREEIRALGFSAPIAVVPNGIDLPAPPPARTGQRRTLLFLSRIHPKKGIEDLLRAWSALQDVHPDWDLVVAGRGPVDYETRVRALAESLGVERVAFPGPVLGAAKSAVYHGADLFVLPTHSENFGMVVAEALAHGCPAVVSHGAPWAGLERERCGWWHPPGVEPLTVALHAAMSLADGARATMGQRGRDWMTREYGWETVSARMAQAYRWILDRGPRPDFVSVER